MEVKETVSYFEHPVLLSCYITGSMSLNYC